MDWPNLAQNSELTTGFVPLIGSDHSTDFSRLISSDLLSNSAEMGDDSPAIFCSRISEGNWEDSPPGVLGVLFQSLMQRLNKRPPFAVARARGN
jgi:hypothetical protein